MYCLRTGYIHSFHKLKCFSEKEVYVRLTYGVHTRIRRHHKKKEKRVCTAYVQCTHKDMSRITVGCKVDIETADRIKREAEANGMSLNGYVKAKLEGTFVDYGDAFGDLFSRISFATTSTDSEDIVRSLIEKIDSGEIVLGAEVELHPKRVLDTKDFEDACFEKGLNAQEEMNKCARLVWNRRTGGDEA